MTNKLAGIKPGDRVRVTFEGVAGKTDAFGFNFVIDGTNVNSWVTGHTLRTSTFHIEKLAEPLKVGDRVKKINGREAGGIVLHLEWDQACVRWPAYLDTVGVDELEKLL